jgi:hypothetical protein
MKLKMPELIFSSIWRRNMCSSQMHKIRLDNQNSPN